MNIFVTNESPIISARDLCDEHVKSKMIVESGIMLAHCFSPDILKEDETPKKLNGEPRKSGKGYYNHCCSKWVRESTANVEWLIEHTLEMISERRYRFPECKPHHTSTFIYWCNENIRRMNVPNGDLTPFAVAINSNMTCRRSVDNFDDLPVVDQYRLYIKHDKDFATWTKRPRPEWLDK